MSDPTPVADSNEPVADFSGPVPRKIRVIEARRSLVDLALVGDEELDVVIANAAFIPALAGARATLESYREVVKRLKRTPLPRDALETIAIRAALANPAIRPIIASRATHGARRFRAATRVRATTADAEDIALAAEEPATLLGFAMDPAAAGEMALREFGNGLFLGLETYATGAGNTPSLAAAGPVHPPLGPMTEFAPELSALKRLAERGFHIAGPDDAAKIFAATTAALLFYQSGAAAAQSLARVAAAVQGTPGAPAALLSELGPKSKMETVIALSSDEPVADSSKPDRSKTAETRLQFLAQRLATVAAVAPPSTPGALRFGLNLLADVFRVGAFGAYLDALIEGRGGPAVDEFIDRAAVINAKAEFAAKSEAAAMAAMVRARQIAIIVADKFGDARAATVLEALRTSAAVRGAPGGSLASPTTTDVNDPEAILRRLTAREREIVRTELANRESAWKFQNRCPHVRLAIRLRSAPTAERALDILKRLEEFAGEPAPGKAKRAAGGPPSQVLGPKGVVGEAGLAPLQWIMCRNCSAKIICPHVRDRIRLEAKRVSFEELRTRLLKYAVRVGGAGEDDITTYFCRICAERIADASPDDDAAARLGRFGDLDAGLRAAVWAAALIAVRDVRFTIPRDERQFAADAAAAIYPRLLAAEEEAAGTRGRRAAVARRGANNGAGDRVGDDDRPEIEPKTALSVLLFVYAYILDVIQAADATFAGLSPGAKASAVAAKMLDLIAERHRGLLARIEDVSSAYVAARFADAYRRMRGEGSSLATVLPEEELAIQTLTVDPIFRAAAMVALVLGDITPTTKPATVFKTILGAPLPEIVRLARERSRDPALSALYLRRPGAEVPAGRSLEFALKGPQINLYANLYEPVAVADSNEPDVDSNEPDVDSNEPDVDSNEPVVDSNEPVGPEPSSKLEAALARSLIATGGRAPRAAKPLRHVSKKAPKQVAPQPRANQYAQKLTPLDKLDALLFVESYRLFAFYTKSVTDQAAFDVFLKRLDRLRRIESGADSVRFRNSISSFAVFSFDRRPIEKPVLVSITARYDEKGLRHIWSIYVFAGGHKGAEGPPILEIRGGLKAVLKARDSGQLTPSMTLSDRVCAVCGVKELETSTLSAEETWKSLRSATEIDGFFMFYESRCPVGGLHEFVARGDVFTCQKCELDAALLKAVNAGVAMSRAGVTSSGNEDARNAALTAEADARRAAAGTAARAYYARFAGAFAAENAIVASPIKLTESTAKTVSLSDEKQYVDEARKWRPDFAVIIAAAALAKTTPAAIAAIGSTEGRDYSDVLEGQNLPPPPETSSDPQIISADAELRLFRSDLEVFRRAVSADSQPLRRAPLSPTIAAILLARGTNSTNDTNTTLPEPSPDYDRIKNAIASVRTPAELLSFIVQSLCELAVTVAAAGDLGRAFAEAELALIVRNQRLFAKPGAFNFAIFLDADLVPEQAGDVGEDVMAELLDDSTREEAADDPFSGDAIDYDTSENNPNNESS